MIALRCEKLAFRLEDADYMTLVASWDLMLNLQRQTPPSYRIV
jgi:hypothetical protein